MLKTLPKMAGSLHLEFKRCGRPRCCCQRGLLHGPYDPHWRLSAEKYVPMKQLGEVLLEIERQRAAAIRPAEVRRELKEYGHA